MSRCLYLIISINFLFTLNLFGQHDWAPVGAEWDYSQFSPGSSNSSISNIDIKSVADTIVLGKEMRKLKYTFTSSSGSITIRDYLTYMEDKKVFINKTNNFEAFELIYDFNLGVGDTVETYFQLTDEKRSYIVQSIDNFIVNGQNIKEWSLTDDCYYYGPKIYELIGSAEGLIPSTCLTIGEPPAISFNCYRDSVVEFTMVEDCNFWGIPNGLNENSNIQLKIYPNPISRLVQLRIDHFAEHLNLDCYSMDGKLIEKLNLNNKYSQIDISNWESGIYYLKIYSTDNYEIRKLIIN